MAPSIPQTMRALQLLKYKSPLEVREVPVPTPGDNDLLLKMGAAGWCHTDYQVWEGVYESQTPIVPSHEPVGTIVSMGPKAEAAGRWKVGQRVGFVLFQHACHHCIGCESTKDIRFCKEVEIHGLRNDGGMSQYMLSDADETVLLPDDVSFEQAAPLLCAGATTWAALMAAECKGPAPVGIIGIAVGSIGGLGAFAVQFAKALGHDVVAIDNRPEGLALAAEVPLPADLVIDFNDKEAVSKIKTWAGRDGLAAVIVCTDKLEPIEWSLNFLRPHGVVVPVGLPVGGIKIDAFTLIFSELIVNGPLVATKLQVEDMLRLVAKSGIKNKVTTVTLDEATKLPDLYMDPHLKGRLVLKF
ncbi:hypothetical protein LTR53_001602 [Teratosphaeriaceae sp. CCFEE 6253]|nr:hypothetical protein LTR53_001602 [Teratosphaeriaceae sp. CCFEE 6253]